MSGYVWLWRNAEMMGLLYGFDGMLIGWSLPYGNDGGNAMIVMAKRGVMARCCSDGEGERNPEVQVRDQGG